ncbi:hypothetical protein [Methanosarcina mazei]|jgi:hypothetical protein|uniref:hypothetical protein n=1 Tax=Methanosarcina mazei TaxID=2209 RepID=UPI00064F771B|nr:hypothetical protein [Methanosarcina mazei]
MTFAEIFNQLKELETKFNEVSYPPENAFLPSFSFKIRKAEKDCLQHDLPAIDVDDFLKKVEQ